MSAFLSLLSKLKRRLVRKQYKKEAIKPKNRKLLNFNKNISSIFINEQILIKLAINAKIMRRRDISYDINDDLNYVFEIICNTGP